MDKNECCPKFNPKPWDKKSFEWKNKRFIKDKVFTLFYIPINFGSVITKMNKKVKKANAKIPDWLGLSDHTTKFNMDLYLAVDKEIPDSDNVTLSGKFISTVYEGPFKDTGKWCKDFESLCKKQEIAYQKTVHVVYDLPKMCKEIWKKSCSDNWKDRINDRSHIIDL